VGHEPGEGESLAADDLVKEPEGLVGEAAATAHADVDLDVDGEDQAELGGKVVEDGGVGE
jgi:hypothetical protein